MIKKITTELSSVGIPYKTEPSKNDSDCVLIIKDRFRRSAEVVLQNLMLKMTYTSDQETIYDNKIKLLWQKG